MGLIANLAWMALSEAVSCGPSWQGCRQAFSSHALSQSRSFSSSALDPSSIGTRPSATALFSLLSPSIVDRFDEFVSAAWKARDSESWEEMVQNLEGAWEARKTPQGVDRFGGGLHHALSFAYLMSGDIERAHQTARAYVALTTQSSTSEEWIGARQLLAETSAQIGDFRTSSDCIRQINRHRGNRGAGIDFQETLNRVTNKEFTYSFRYGYEQFSRQFDARLVPAFLPRADLPYQSATYKVVGAKSANKMRKGEQVWLEVTPNGREPFYVEGTVTQKVYSFWPDIQALRKARGADLSSNDPYLGESYGVTLTGQGVEIARILKGRTQWETIRNVARWMKANIPYANDGSDKYIIHGEDALKHRKGVCNPRALATVTLMRLCGVPCRVVRGMGSFTTPPGWHTWIEIRSPLKDANGNERWVPTDVGSTVTDFPKYLGMQFYPSVAPFSMRAFEWETWYTFNIETVKYSDKVLTLPDSGERIQAS